MLAMPTQHPRLPLSTLSTLPPENRSTPRTHILTLLTPPTPKLVILDDDPTGTQTCHDIAVLTTFEIPTLQAELLRPSPGFFVLTNTRALGPSAARALLQGLLENLRVAAAAAGAAFSIVLRGDSTLRGHFPLECDVVEAVFGASDAWVLAPFFLQGGRYTLGGVHYVAEGQELVPVGETAFARDATFGFAASAVGEWVQEKAPGRWGEGRVVGVSVRDIREGGAAGVAEVLRGVPRGAVVVVDACAESDMDVFAAGVLEAESHGTKLLFRTAAAFVSSRLGMIPQPPLSAHDAGVRATPGGPGALIVAGSYVPKTTVQLSALIRARGDRLEVLELSVESLLSEKGAEAPTNSTAEAASAAINAGRDVLIMTSRALVKGSDAESSLGIGGVVAAALVRVVQRVSARPRYIVAKGGITSSDIATKALRMRRAVVLGQAAPGVPLWRCDEAASMHAGVPYVVFPGNVGGDDALARLVEGWAV